MLKSFEERVLIFTTSIENLYILKWQIIEVIVETIGHKDSHSKTWIKSKEIDIKYIKMDLSKIPKEKVIKVDNKWQQQKGDNTNRLKLDIQTN